MKYYLVGIKGTGMSALAKLLKDQGNEVVGSDVIEHYFTEDSLIEKGITIKNFDENNIDSDYFYSDNEGHIFAKITNDSNENKTVELEAGSGFMQGIFVEYGITMDDDVTAVRNGGFGSTSQK